MNPCDQLTPRQQFLHKNLVRVIFYGAFAVVLLWSMNRMVELEEEKQEQYRRVEDTMMDFYRETRAQMDTLDMAEYMRGHLSSDDYDVWLKQGK